VAIRGGPIALISASGSFLLCFAVVAAINRLIQRSHPAKTDDEPALDSDVVQTK
jgi:hypothetical protein